MKSSDLSIPIYLNQQVVFDLLATLDDGFSHLSTIRTSTNESESTRTGLGSSIGVSNVFALLGVSFSGERGRERGTQDQTEISQEKVHTPTSLFAKLRIKLNELHLLRTLGPSDQLETLSSGEFVEFRALLRKNPLVETVEGFKQVMEMAMLFEGDNSGQKSGSHRGKQPLNPNTAMIRQMEGILTALNQSSSIELVGELLDSPDVRAVLTARPDFFSQSSTAEIIDGEFRVFGKVTRVLPSDSSSTINLLRKTSFAMFDRRLFDDLSQALAGLETAGLRSTKLVTEIEGPALLVLPIAIFA